MKQKTLVYGVIIAVFVLGGLLSACTPAAVEVEEEAPAAAEPTAVPDPTAVPSAVPEPTAVPTAVPEPLDYAALFTEAIADINPSKRYLSPPPAILARELSGTAPFVLDVREDAEIEAYGYIEGAVHIPLRDLMKNLDKLPALDAPVIVISASGHPSGFALAALKMIGYTNVRNLDGGMEAWIEDGQPIVTGTPEVPVAISTPIIENQQLWTALDAWLSNLPKNLSSIQLENLNANLVSGDIPVLIDVRSADEQSQDGYIKGAVNIPITEFMDSLDQLPADKAAPVVVYCSSGFRGAVAAMAMQSLGYTDVVNLVGGLDAWKAAQPPLEFYVGWLSATPLPEPTAGGLVQCSDDPDSFYLVGGVVENFWTSDRLYRYDIDAGSWVRLADLPKPNRLSGVACYQGNIYMAGGWEDMLYDTLYIYNIAEDQWIEGKALPEAVWGAALGAWDGKLYLVGGNRGADNLAPDNQVDVYDIVTGTWKAGIGAKMPTASCFYASVQVGSYLYVVGGFSGDVANNVNQTQRYDMATNTWEVGPTFTSARAYGNMAATSSHLYMGGGDMNGNDIADATDMMERLDLTTWPEGEWEVLTPLPVPNIWFASGCSEILTGGEIWNVGGADTSSTWILIDAVYYLPVGEGCP